MDLETFYSAGLISVCSVDFHYIAEEAICEVAIRYLEWVAGEGFEEGKSR